MEDQPTLDGDIGDVDGDGEQFGRQMANSELSAMDKM